MEEAYDSNPTNLPYQAFAPENFRKIIQRQINTTVDTQLDLIVSANKELVDIRFGNSLPSELVQTKNEHQLPYFVVGRSIVGRLFVAAP
jgi:hypothetical protein